ncbi:DNA translocase FtsK [Spiroplasma chrysopicola]|uniref:DNA translocase n=1 Tax=Spiroplasma chrysopicola DF-1 TaxID=1276227 RepID=R4U0I9_9MOLU|nr:DNA translocase FtsK [Spiroplasma chrysopicola]AGM24767.1 DNA translocase [Spiroplasma chrysopicola DF-1]
MKKRTYTDHPLNDQNQTTAIIKVEKKPRRNDAIGWVIGALLVVFFTIISVGRITLIGQFIDDVIFTFLFGWFKYLLYFCCLIVGLTIFLGVKIKIKRRVRWMTICFIILTCWLVSAILLIYQFSQNQMPFFDQQSFLNIIKAYIKNWQNASIFSPEALKSITFVGFNGQWITLGAGGGIIGNFLAGVFSYLTIFGSVVLCLILYLGWFSWVFTGSFLGLFLPKQRRRNKGIRVTRLWSNKAKKIKKPGNNSIYQSLNVPDDEFFTPQQVMHTTESSDITIQMPSYTALHDQQLIEDLIADDFVGKKKTKQNYVKFDDYNSQPPQQPRDSNFVAQQDFSYSRTGGVKKPVVPQPDQYIQPRNRRSGLNSGFDDNRNINDLPVYSSAFGQNVDLNEARNKLNSQANITPFGKIKRDGAPSNPPTAEQTSLYDDSGEVKDFNQPREPQTLVNSTPITSTPEVERPTNDFWTAPPKPQPKVEIFDRPRRNVVIDKREPVLTSRPPAFNNPNYKLPNLTLLNEKQDNANNNEQNKMAAHNKALKINEVFQQFNIAASVQGVNIGPTITKFEIQMQPGVKVNKIMSLENDLKYALATQTIRIEAPIQGKSAVGIEIANQISNKVTLREIMERIPLEKQDKKLLVAIGRSVNGDIIFVELDKMPHLLVAGSTGSGKSVCINTILSSLLLRTKPSEVKLLLIDPKQVELAVYNNLPHLLTPVISDTKLANPALKKVIAEMERRYSLLSTRGVRNIEAFNLKVTPEEKLPYIVIIIDELADLMMTAGKEIEDSIMRITQLARAAGIHMIIATQRPSTDVITGVIKTNIPSRIAFAVASSIDSRTILDQSGAEKLIGYGDMLYAPAGQNIPTRAQGAYISDDEIERLVEYCQSQQETSYDEDFLNIENSHNGVNNGDLTSELDPLYQEIKNFVILNQKASTSLIQRKFSIGYNRASRLMDTLEENGVIGPQNGAKPRDVYIQNIDLDDNDY